MPFTEKTVYDNVGNILSTTDGENRTITYVYDDSNRRIKSTDLLNHSTYTGYDRVGNITKVTDAKGRVTNYGYDALNRQTLVTQAYGTVDVTTMGYGYDAVGNLTSETNGLSISTNYTYDALNRRIATTDIYNDVTKTEYYDTPTLIATAIALELPTIIDTTNIGKIVKQIDANGHSTLSVYDIQGHLTDTYDGIRHLTSHQTYYNDDRIKTATDTFGKITNYTYQDNLRQTTIVNPLGVTTTKKYDKVGNLTDNIDTQGRTTHYEYDELNRQKTIMDAVGGITGYTYYNDGKTKTIQDAVDNTNNTISNTTTYTYDQVGRLSKEHTALGDRIYGYDEVNNRTSVLDRAGRNTNYTYDSLNRIKTETWVETGKQFTYTYDKNSNRLSADDGSIKYNYSYDNTDLLTQVDRISGTNPIVSFQYGYDKVGNLTKADELTGATIQASTVYKYDDSRNLNTEITQTGAGLVSKQVKFTYDPTGQTAKIERYANGQLAVTTNNAYDTFGRLTGIEQKNSAGVVIANSSYGFDNLNRLTSETIDGVNRLIGYDKIDQVKSVTGSNSEAYTYDENGNRKNGGYATGVNNQLLNDGTYSYEYDKEGNRTKRTNTATGAVDNYTWDYRNRLTGVISQDTSAVVTQTVSYEYDVDNQRVSKTVGGVVEKYVIDRNQIAYVTDGSGTQTFHYLYGTNVDAVMAQDSPTGMVWSLSDRLGSVNLLTDAGGVVVDKRTFDSFGRVLSETNPGVKFRYGYTGREQDQETGLDYYRARYYDAANGRFISVDPIGFEAGDTNLYRYVGNSSTMYTDPSGEWALPSWNDVVQGATNFRNTVTSNAQTGLEYWAGLSVQGQNEGGFVGGAKQFVGTGFGLLSSLATEDNIDKTSLVLGASLGIARLGATGLKGAAYGGTGGFGYGVADQLDRGQSITSINWQEVGDKTTVGLIGGAAFATAFTGAATTLGSFIPANTLRFAGFGLSALGIGAQTGTAINHAGEGKFWTAGLDLVTAGTGWLALRSSANKFTNQYEKMQQEAQEKLNDLIVSLGSKTQRRKYSAAIVAMDTKTMQVGDARLSGLPVPSKIDKVLEQRSNQIGGVGSTGVTTAASGNGKGNIVGACAEYHSGNDLLAQGTKIHNLKFTMAVQPRDPGTHVPTCPNCQKIFKESFSLSENLVDKIMQNSIKKGG